MGVKDSLLERLLDGADTFDDKHMAEVLELLVAQGIERRASDIHIEPGEHFGLVRYRIDGTLRRMYHVPQQALSSLLAQLKTLAKLDNQEVHMPQEGEYEQMVEDKRVNARVSTMPVFGGEKAVLHLTLEHGQPMDLNELGFWGDGLATLKTTLASPAGLILVSGPKHSGVSSTLFGLLHSLNSPVHNIATIESGPKHRLPGVNQTYLANGLSMHEALQATLKQDPNIIMVDGLHSGGATELAIQAATSGHLILVGMRESNSISALLRLRHSSVEPFLLANALRASIGQRLVRRLCPDCRERYELDHEGQQQLAEDFGLSTANSYQRLHELERSMTSVVPGDSHQLNSDPDRISHLWRPNEAGCNTCHHTGYHGRIAIVEVLKNTDTLHKALLSHDTPTPAQLRQAVLKHGFIPMGLDGLLKALRGLTTVGEVLRQLVDRS